MQLIVERLANDDAFLDIILQTSYFTWQYKYLQTLVKVGNALLPRTKSKSWQIRDIILLIKNDLSKVHLIAALLNYSEKPGYERYVLSEKELFELHRFMRQPEKNFVRDLLQAISSSSDLVKKRAYNFIRFIEPDSYPDKTLDFEPSLMKVKTILETFAVGVKIDTEPLKPILKSITDYMNNHIKISKLPNQTETSNSRPGTVEEVVDDPLLIIDK